MTPFKSSLADDDRTMETVCDGSQSLSSQHTHRHSSKKHGRKTKTEKRRTEHNIELEYRTPSLSHTLYLTLLVGLVLMCCDEPNRLTLAELKNYVGD